MDLKWIHLKKIKIEMDKLNNNENNDVESKRTTDFSIDSILGNRSSEEVRPQSQPPSLLSPHHIRPLNKFFSNPWTSTGPILYNPEFHHQSKNTTTPSISPANLYFHHHFPMLSPITSNTPSSSFLSNFYHQNFVTNNCDLRDNFKSLSSYYNSSENNNNNSIAISKNILEKIVTTKGQSLNVFKSTQSRSFSSTSDKSSLANTNYVIDSKSELEIFSCSICDKVFGCSGTLEVSFIFITSIIDLIKLFQTPSELDLHICPILFSLISFNVLQIQFSIDIFIFEIKTKRHDEYLLNIILVIVFFFHLVFKRLYVYNTRSSNYYLCDVEI